LDNSPIRRSHDRREASIRQLGEIAVENDADGEQRIALNHLCESDFPSVAKTIFIAR
jgi:hypothetical protein